jgi:hypothetical protein
MKKVTAYIAFGFLLLSACVDGFKEENEWTSTTTNKTLTNPTFTKDDNIEISADGSQFTIKWPVVAGASGYQVSVYKLTGDEFEPELLLGEANQIVDGLSVTHPNEDDSEYKLVFKALGNEKFNNRDAAATTFEWNNSLDVTYALPSGESLNSLAVLIPLHDSVWDKVELCYELEAGGTYTMNNNLSFNNIPTTIRGNKGNRPTLTISSGSFVNVGGLKFKDINVVVTGSDPFITLSAGAAHVVPTKYPIALQNVEIKGLKNQLVALKASDAIGTLLVQNCLVGWNAVMSNSAFGGNTNGYIKDMTVTESTFYNEQVGSGSDNYFIRLHGSTPANVPGGELWTTGSAKFTNCTFYQMGGTQFYNANGKNWKANTDVIAVEKCVFVDSYWDGSGKTAEEEAVPGSTGTSSTGIIRRIRSSSTAQQFTANYNTYWWASASHPQGFIHGEVVHANGDKSSTVIKDNPSLTYQGDGRFMMMGETQQNNKTGDPRWLLDM